MRGARRQRALGRRRRRRPPSASPRPAAIASTRGSRDRRDDHLVPGGQRPAGPAAGPPRARPGRARVSSTTRARWRTPREHRGDDRRASRSPRASGSSGAIASTSAGSRSGPVAPVTAARGPGGRRRAGRPGRRPGRRARRAAARRPSRRPGGARRRPGRRRCAPVSRTSSTRRSRSGRQVRTITSAARAVARQSIERTSSPATYSRSESNSVPCPRTCTRACGRRARAAAPAARAGAGATGTPAAPAPPRHRVRALPARPARAGPSARTVDPVGAPVPAARRAAASCVTRRPLARRRPRAGAGATAAPGRRRPRVAQHAAHPAAARVSRREGDRRRLAEAHGRSPGSREAQRAHRPGERDVHSANASSAPSTATSHRPTAPRRPPARRRQRDGRAAGHRQRHRPLPRQPRRSAGSPDATVSQRRQRRDRDGGEDAVEHAVGGDALELGLGPQLHPVPQRRPGEGLDVVRGDVVAAGRATPTPGRSASSAVAPRGDTPRRSDGRRSGWRGTRSTTYADDLGRDRHRRGPRRGAGREVGRRRRPARRPAAARSRGSKPAGVPPQHLDLVVARGQRHGQLEQEPVELRLGQRVGALVLDGVLRRGDDERLGQRPRRAVDGDLPLLHRLEQRRPASSAACG